MDTRSPLTPLQTAARSLLILEPVILALILAVFWFPDTGRVFSLLLFVPVFLVRFVAYRRLWQPTPLDPLMGILLILCMVNLFVAPFEWGMTRLNGPFGISWFPVSYDAIMIGRPLMGILLATSLADFAWRRGRTDSLIYGAIIFGLCLGILALGASQWSEKSNLFRPWIDTLPRIAVLGSFNVNEIAGALASFAPLTAGVTILYLHPSSSLTHKIMGSIAGIAFATIALALFLGQSRAAILGVIPVLGVLVWQLLPRGRGRNWALAALATFIVAEGLIVAKVFDRDIEQAASRDEDSFSGRLGIMGSAIRIIADYPLTGSGINTFRAGSVRAQYPVVGYEPPKVLPHTHNEILQIGADLGVPGIMVLLAIYGVTGRSLFRIWRRGDRLTGGLALTLGAALGAHAIYGMFDAITLWDRLAFVFWSMIGLGMALVITQPQRAGETENEKGADSLIGNPRPSSDSLQMKPSTE